MGENIELYIPCISVSSICGTKAAGWKLTLKAMGGTGAEKINICNIPFSHLSVTEKTHESQPKGKIHLI